MIRGTVHEATERAERMLEEADVRAKQEWSERFIAGTKKVQAPAAQAHHYLTPEDWSMEPAERFIVDLRTLRDNARKLRTTVPTEACQPAVRKAVSAANSKMEQA